MRLRLVVVTLLLSTMSVILPARVSAVDALTWYDTPYSVSDGDTLTGTKRLIVRSNTSGYISKWCVYLDGNPLTGRQYDDDYRPIGLTSSVYWSSRQRGSTDAPSQTTPGCWEFSSVEATTGFDISLDTSTWSNGNHTFKIEATPSVGSVHSKTVSVITTNTLPSVEWVSQSAQTASDFVFLTARLRPGGVPRIAKACLSRDGSPVISTDNIYFEGNTSYGNIPSNPGPDGRFGTASGGCVNFDDLQSNAWPPGLHQLTTLTIGVPTVRWADQPTALTLSIVDAADRIFSSPITLNVSNSKPKMVLPAFSNTTVWEDAEIRPSFSRSGSSVSRICISGSTITDQNVIMSYSSPNGSGNFPPVNGCWTNQSLLTAIETQSGYETILLKFKTQLMTNGTHSLTITSTDSLGKSDYSSHSFSVNNGAPGVAITTPTSGAQLSNWTLLTATASMPSHMKSTWISQTCISLATSKFCSNVNGGLVSSVINTSCLPNGSTTISSSALDSSGKSGSSVTSVVINNKQPTSHSVKVKSNSPAWNSPHISGRVSLNASGACSYLIEILDSKGKKTSQRMSGEFQAKSQYDAEFYFTKLKPSTRYKVRITLTNSGGSSTRLQSFTTPSLPPRPKANLFRQLCPIGIRMDLCVSRLGQYPLTVDCTGRRRSWITRMELGTPFWIIGYGSGTPIISEHPRVCL